MGKSREWGRTMKIVVINESPKGKYSVTLQSVRYLVGAMLSDKKVMKKVGNKMNEGMLMPYEKVLDEMEQPSRKG